MSFADSIRTEKELAASQMVDVPKKKKVKKPKELGWDDFKVVYVAYKLGRRNDAYMKYPGRNSPLTGQQFSGLECYASNLWTDQDTDEVISETQGVDGFIPKRHTQTTLQASRYNSGNCWLRTSLIEDFYIHEDEVNSADKIVLPSWAALDVLDGIEFAKGDILLRTMNSFYFLKAQRISRK